MKWRAVRGAGRKEQGKEEEGIIREEVRNVIRKLKDGKAMGRWDP